MLSADIFLYSCSIIAPNIFLVNSVTLNGWQFFSWVSSRPPKALFLSAPLLGLKKNEFCFLATCILQRMSYYFSLYGYKLFKENFSNSCDRFLLIYLNRLKSCTRISTYQQWVSTITRPNCMDIQNWPASVPSGSRESLCSPRVWTSCRVSRLTSW